MATHTMIRSLLLGVWPVISAGAQMIHRRIARQRARNGGYLNRYQRARDRQMLDRANRNIYRTQHNPNYM